MHFCIVLPGSPAPPPPCLEKLDTDTDAQAAREALSLARDERHGKVELDSQGVKAGMSVAAHRA